MWCAGGVEINMRHFRQITKAQPQSATAVTDLFLTIKAAFVDFQFSKQNNVISGV